MCFLVTMSFWSLIYIAQQIDQPFGADANDLPVYQYQQDFNKSLVELLKPLSLKAPAFHWTDPEGQEWPSEGEFTSEPAVLTKMVSSRKNSLGRTPRSSSSLAAFKADNFDTTMPFQ